MLSNASLEKEVFAWLYVSLGHDVLKDERSNNE